MKRLRLLAPTNARKATFAPATSDCLSAAVARGDLWAAETLLAAGADAGAMDRSTGGRPLHTAVRLANRKQSVALTALLLRYAADPWQEDSQGMLPVHAAAEVGNERALEVLVEADACLLDAQLSTTGQWPLHVAAGLGHLAAAEVLLLAGEDANRQDKCGQTPLHLAAAAGQALMVRLLLNHGSDPTLPDRQEQLALHTAAASFCALVDSRPAAAEALLCLIQHSPHLLAAQAEGVICTPLHILCHRLHKADPSSVLWVLQRLAGGRPLDPEWLNVADCRGRTPLRLAAQACNPEAARLLLQCGADPNAACQHCWQHLGHASSGGLGLGSANMRVHHGPHMCPMGAAIDCCTKHDHGIDSSIQPGYDVALALLAGGASAAGHSEGILMQALKHQRADVVLALLAAGLPYTDVRPLLWAVEQGQVDMLQELLAGGVDPNCPSNPEAAMQLLEAALRAGREEVLHALLSHERNYSMCSSSQAAQPPPPSAPCLDLTALSQRAQRNPANFAVRRSSVPALRRLLAAGCPTGAVPAGQQALPPLVEAASRLDTQRCQVLLEAGASVAETDARGQSARGQSALDAVLALCTDAQLIQLTADETEGASAATERQLLQLVELLHGAGATCTRFLAEHDNQAELVHATLLLAAGLPAWSSATHSSWPAAFRRAARAALLVLRGRGVASAMVACRQQGWDSCGSGSGRGGGGSGVKRDARQMLHLPCELCHVILDKAAMPVSCWVAAE